MGVNWGAVAVVAGAGLFWFATRENSTEGNSDASTSTPVSGGSPIFDAGDSDSGSDDVVDIENLKQAIYNIEGPGKRDRNKNPGNLTYGTAKWLKAPGVVGSDGRFAVFGDMGDGWDALDSYIRRQAQRHPDWSLYEFARHVLGQPTDHDTVTREGNTASYAKSLADYLGVDPGDTFAQMGI